MPIYKETNKDKIPKKYKKLKQVWYYRTYYTDIYGNKKQKQSKYYESKSECEDAERFFLNTIFDIEVSPGMKFSELKNDFLKYKKEHLKITSYTSLFVRAKHLDILGNIKISEFNYAMYKNWVNYINNFRKKNGDELATKTKNEIQKILKEILYYGNRMYNTKIDVIAKMDTFKNPNEFEKSTDFYTEEEFKTFISYEEDIKWIAFFNTLFYCGLRQGEACGLTWRDYNGHSLSINKAACNRIKGKDFLILPPKTKSSIRDIPITKNLAELINNLYKEQSQYSNFTKDWFIFGNMFPLSPTTIQKRRDKLVELSGVKRIRIHDFRHSTASLLISKGCNVTLLAKYLGHNNTSTTLNVYSHFYQNDLDKIVKSIEF